MERSTTIATTAKRLQRGEFTVSLSYLTQPQFLKSTTVKTNRTKQYKDGPTGSIRIFNRPYSKMAANKLFFCLHVS